MISPDLHRSHDCKTTANIENGHQILSNSVSNSSTNSNVSAFSISSNQSENNITGQCPTLPDSFILFKNPNTHQCLKPSFMKHQLIHQTNHHLLLSNHIHHKTRPQNILPISSSLHRKIDYTSSSSSNSTLSSSGCVSASSNNFLFSSSCSPSVSPLSGPQTPQSLNSNNVYVQSPLAQSSTTDSGLCLNYHNERTFSERLNDRLNDKVGDRIIDLMVEPLNEFNQNNDIIKKKDLLSNKKSNLIGHKIINTNYQLRKNLLNLPNSLKPKKENDESLLSDYSKSNDLINTSSDCDVNSNFDSINATSSTNLVASIKNKQKTSATITAKPSLSGCASSSFFHYPNIYNPLKNTKNSNKNNKKLIRFMTVVAYVIAGKRSVTFFYTLK